MRFGVLFLAAAIVLSAQMAAVPGAQAPKPEDLCTIEGHIVNAATGAPVSNASVLLTRADAPPNSAGPPQSFSTMTNASGDFAMKDLDVGKYRMVVTRNGFVTAPYGARSLSRPGTILTLDRGQHMTGVNFRLTPHGVVTGHILDENGEPVPYVSVQLLRTQYVEGKKRLAVGGSASTNDLGEYRIFGVAPGKYYIRATVTQNIGNVRATQDRSATPPPEEEYVPIYFPGTTDAGTGAQIEVTSGGTLSGVNMTLSKVRAVHIKGHIVNNAIAARRPTQLWITSRVGAGLMNPMRSQQADAKGDFDIHGVIPGSYILTAAVYDANKNYTGRVPVEVGNSNLENVSVVILPPMEIPGKVRIEGDVKPDLSSLDVYLQPKEGELMFTSRSSARVQDDYTFRLQDVTAEMFHIVMGALPDGFYVKAVRSGDADVQDTGLDVTRGVPGPLEVVLSPNAGLVTGAVQNPNIGLPAPGVQVVLVPKQKERQEQQKYYRSTTTDQNGSYTLKNIVPGDYTAFAWEDIEPGAYMDPDHLKAAEGKGESVTVHESDRQTVMLQMIPADAPSSAAQGQTARQN